MQAIAATLFEEGATTLIYVVLVHCKYMLERSSNSYGKSFFLNSSYFVKEA
jgi:hypothetical protein